MSKFLKILLLFVIILGGIVYFFSQRNTYSKGEMRIEIFGPSEVEAGAQAEYVVRIKNNGSFKLRNPDLIFQAPDFSLKDGAPFDKQSMNSEQLGGDIYPGEERSFTFKINLLGKEGDTKIARASITYQPENLKVRYESNTTFTTIIKDVPLDFSFDLPAQIEADKNFNFRVNYSSNANWLLTNLRITLDYPSGFEFIEASPKAIGKTEWDIPVLNSGAAGNISITGRLNGDIGEAKIFRARIGAWENGKYLELKDIQKGIQIQTPTVELSCQINGNTDYIAKPGEWLHYVITFKNVSNSDQYNLVMINKLDGDLYDLSTIKSDTGNFQPGDSSIIFDGAKNPTLQYLPTMGQGSVEFWVKLKDAIISKPLIINRVAVGAAREDFTTRVNATANFTQLVFYNDEVFGNTGPLPPKAGQPTSYTITWQLKNYFTPLKNVQVTAVLPANVLWTGNMFPDNSTSTFAYDNVARQITWNVGDLSIGQGAIANAPGGPNISFQIILTPTFEQVGSRAALIGEVKVSAIDAISGETVNISVPALDTGSLSDQNMTDSWGIVTN